MRRCLISRRPPSFSSVSLKLSSFKQTWQKLRGCPIPTVFLKTEMRQRQKLLLPAREAAVCTPEPSVGVVLPVGPVTFPTGIWFFLLPSTCQVPALQCGRGSWRSCECWPGWRVKEHGRKKWERAFITGKTRYITARMSQRRRTQI